MRRGTATAMARVLSLFAAAAVTVATSPWCDDCMWEPWMPTGPLVLDGCEPGAGQDDPFCVTPLPSESVAFWIAFDSAFLDDAAAIDVSARLDGNGFGAALTAVTVYADGYAFVSLPETWQDLWRRYEERGGVAVTGVTEVSVSIVVDVRCTNGEWCDRLEGEYGIPVPARIDVALTEVAVGSGYRGVALDGERAWRLNFDPETGVDTPVPLADDDGGFMERPRLGAGAGGAVLFEADTLFPTLAFVPYDAGAPVRLVSNLRGPLRDAAVAGGAAYAIDGAGDLWMSVAGVTEPIALAGGVANSARLLAGHSDIFLLAPDGGDVTLARLPDGAALPVAGLAAATLAAAELFLGGSADAMQLAAWTATSPTAGHLDVFAQAPGADVLEHVESRNAYAIVRREGLPLVEASHPLSVWPSGGLYRWHDRYLWVDAAGVRVYDGALRHVGAGFANRGPAWWRGGWE